jgi:hypothetical protein
MEAKTYMGTILEGKSIGSKPKNELKKESS